MRAHSFTTCVVAASLLVSSLAVAQTCRGTASFRTGQARLDGGIRSIEAGTFYDGGGSIGAGSGPFGGGAISRLDFKDNRSAATIVGASAGYGKDLNATGTGQVCPMASVNYEWVPSRGLVGQNTTDGYLTFGLGASLGGAVSLAPSFDVVPYGSALFEAARFPDASSSSYRTLVEIGVGLVIHQRVTLRPSASFTIGPQGSQPTVGLGISYNFGPTR